MSQNKPETCRLCHHQMTFFANARNRNYFRCAHCDSIQMSHEHIISLEQEKARYDTHQNDVLDLGYQSFVSPITRYVFENLKPSQRGLDFGAGPGPVIAKVLKDQGYHLKLYDPFFHKDDHVLRSKYDYIIACEVIEHFNHPDNTFNQLSQLIKPDGQWIFMTDIYDDSKDFLQWPYKNDETHVIFYTKKTLTYLKNIYLFDQLVIQGRLILYKRKTA